jgi:hypothetical protein
VFINGAMYMDGGTRQSVFFESVLRIALANWDKNLFGILHGDLKVPPEETRNNLLGITSRTAAIAIDQLFIDSAYRMNTKAQAGGFEVRWTAAAGTGCAVRSSDDFIDPALGNCLWQKGLERSNEDHPWKKFDELFPP